MLSTVHVGTGALARPGRAAARFRLIYDHIISVGLRRKISVHNLGLEPSTGNDFFLEPLLNGTKLLLHQPQIILLRGCLQLPLVLEQRRVVDVLKDLAQIEIFLHAHAPEWWPRNIWCIAYHGTALGEYRTSLLIHCRGFGVLLHRAPLLQPCIALSVGRRQILHDVQA